MVNCLTLLVLLGIIATTTATVLVGDMRNGVGPDQELMLWTLDTSTRLPTFSNILQWQNSNERFYVMGVTDGAGLVYLLFYNIDNTTTKYWFEVYDTATSQFIFTGPTFESLGVGLSGHENWFFDSVWKLVVRAGSDGDKALFYTIDPYTGITTLVSHVVILNRYGINFGTGMQTYDSASHRYFAVNLERVIVSNFTYWGYHIIADLNTGATVVQEWSQHHNCFSCPAVAPNSNIVYGLNVSADTSLRTISLETWDTTTGEMESVGGEALNIVDIVGNGQVINIEENQFYVITTGRLKGSSYLATFDLTTGAAQQSSFSYPKQFSFYMWLGRLL